MKRNLLKDLTDTNPIKTEELQQKFIDEVRVFESAVVREQIFNLYTIKLNVQTELALLDKRLSEIKKIDNAKSQRIFFAMSMWFTIQFGVSGYTIYCVPWLGWDLVEPFTYTISQGSFILGLLYMYNHRGVSADSSGSLSNYW